MHNNTTLKASVLQKFKVNSQLPKENTQVDRKSFEFFLEQNYRNDTVTLTLSEQIWLLVLEETITTSILQ